MFLSAFPRAMLRLSQDLIIKLPLLCFFFLMCLSHLKVGCLVEAAVCTFNFVFTQLRHAMRGG